MGRNILRKRTLRTCLQPMRGTEKKLTLYQQGNDDDLDQYENYRYRDANEYFPNYLLLEV